MTLEKRSLTLLAEALEKLDEGFSALPAMDPDPDLDRIRAVLLEVAERMQENYPYHHPFYLGQMLKPPHPMARIAYALSLWINPNNHALDGGRASSTMEKEAVAQLAAMFGWQTHLGHLCGGGTMANLEGLWVARSLRPNATTLASDQAHYTHQRICGVLRQPFQAVVSDRQGRMDVDALRTAVDAGDIGTVVVTMGTTATGSVDPLPAVLQMREEYGFRVHADAAYGGYFILADDLAPETRASFECLGEVDSIAVDPHKHGLQPYGCGCILFKDPSVGAVYKHESPYTYFTSSDLHLGEISLECSRPGAPAAALWATQKLLPPIRGGEFARDLGHCRQAAKDLHGRLRAESRFVVPFEPELDIVVWAPRQDSVEEASRLSRAIFEEAASSNLHLALAELPVALFGDRWVDQGRERVTCLRSCLMKPEHLEWLDRIWDALMDAAIRSGF